MPIDYKAIDHSLFRLDIEPHIPAVEAI